MRRLLLVSMPVFVALGMVIGLTAALGPVADAGVRNCRPAWKCQPATPPPPSGFTLNTYASTDFSTPAAAGTVEQAYHLYAYPWGYDDTSNNGHYDPGIISVHDGLLDAFIHTRSDGIHRVAAFGPCLSAQQDNPVAVNCQQNQLYGRYEVRARVDSMHGYKGAWLLWPKSEVWPRDGEIDFPEGDFDSTISAFMHRQDGTHQGDQDAYGTTARWTDWHTYVTEWTAGLVKFFLDGVLIGHSTSRVPNTPMRQVIQNETTLDNFEPADSVQGHVLIEYLKVWSWSS